jgi:type II secretory pathway predicted ATPase ExeA
VYPLAVANLLMASMNDAAELGAPKVTAELIKAVRA